MEKEIIIIKRISRAPIYHTIWQRRVLYNNTNHTHTHARTHTRTHTNTHTHTHTHTHAHTHMHRVSDEGMGRAVKNRVALKEEVESEWRNVFRLHLNESREGFCRRGKGRSFHVDGPKYLPCTQSCFYQYDCTVLQSPSTLSGCLIERGSM